MAPKKPNLEVVDITQPKPNQNVIVALTGLLELAKSGKLRGFAGVADLGPSTSTSFISGKLSPMETIGCLYLLTQQLARNVSSHSVDDFDEVD